MFKHLSPMFDHFREYILKFNRHKIDTITCGDGRAWVIGISTEKDMIEDEERQYYSFPCVANETAAILVDEYSAKGMKRGQCEKGGASVYIMKA